LRARSEGANSLLSLRDEKPSSAAAAKPERPKPPPADAAATVQTTTKLSVLVVEDDVINSKILCKRLKMDGHTVKAVENGQEAVDALAADWNYDIVFMDIQMPIMDGRRAAAEIRNLERSLPDGTEGTPTSRPFRMDGRIPIVAVSASLYEKDHVEIGTHFSGWLLKPLSE
jgi:CheY-like chemotaxis protein